MEKRLPIFLLLAVAVYVGWSLLANQLWPPPPVERRPAPAHTAPRSVDPSRPAVEPTAAAEKAAPAAATDARADLSARIEDTEERTLVITRGTPGEPGALRAVFSNRGASLVELRIGDYYVRERLGEAERADWKNWTTVLASVKSSGRSTGSLSWRTIAAGDALRRAPLESVLWSMRELEDQSGVAFVHAPGLGVRFEKRVRFVPGTYRIEVELQITNEALDAAAARTSFVFRPAEVVPLESGDRFYQEPLAVGAGRPSGARSFELAEFDYESPDASGRTLKGSLDVPGEPLSYAGVGNKYFACLMHAADARSKPTLVGAAWEHLRDDAYAASGPEAAAQPYRLIATDVLLSLTVPAQGETATWKYLVYAGPKDREVLEAENPDFVTLTRHDFGFFNGIASFLVAVLRFFHSLVGNWGVAIILLTFSVRLVLFPINRKSQTAMARYQKKMKRVQPEIEALKKRHAGDPQQLRQEQAKLMQREGLMPPLGGCLPIFLQIPVFFGLFSALRTSLELRQAPFAFWISDLAKPDRLLPLGWKLPLYGPVEYLNVLPPLMVVLWVVQQMLMPKPADEQQAKMQRMMMFMPVLMGFFLYEYAAGLSLYMITQSTLGILETTWIKKLWPIDDRERPPSKTGFLARVAKMHEEQQRKLAARSKQRPGESRKKSGKGR